MVKNYRDKDFEGMLKQCNPMEFDRLKKKYEMNDAEKEEDRTYSWETWRCKGQNNDGSRCKNPIRRGHIKETGEIFVPLTCSKHINQEEEIRRELKER